MKVQLPLLPKVQRGLARLNEIDPCSAGIAEVLAACSETLQSISETQATAMLGILNPAALGTNVPAGIAQLFQHVHQMLVLLRHVGACRLAEILSGVLSSLEQSYHTQACLLARASMEHAAIAQWRQRQLSPVLARVDELDPNSFGSELTKGGGRSIFAAVLPAISLLDKCFGAARFNRRALLEFEDLRIPIELDKEHEYRQVGVMEAVEACEWKGPLWPATTPRFFYELLCDYVHPNAGSNLLYVDQESVTDIEGPSGARNRLVARVTAHCPEDDSLLLHVLQVVCIPLRESASVLNQHLRWLGTQIERREAFLESLERLGYKPLLAV